MKCIKVFLDLNVHFPVSSRMTARGEFCVYTRGPCANDMELTKVIAKRSQERFQGPTESALARKVRRRLGIRHETTAAEKERADYEEVMTSLSDKKNVPMLLERNITDALIEWIKKEGKIKNVDESVYLSIQKDTVVTLETEPTRNSFQITIRIGTD